MSGAMKITLRLFATLTQYLPAGADKHEIELDVADGTTPAAVIKQFNLPPELAHMTFINGVYLAPEERDKRPLKDQDKLAVFPPIAGGTGDHERCEPNAGADT
jgi:molybdopterin converting factor small subunit